MLRRLFGRKTPAAADAPALAAAPKAPKVPSRFVTLNPDGTAAAFYSDDVHGQIPAEAAPLTEAQYRQWHEGQGAVPMRQYKLVSGRLVDHVPEPTPAQRAHAALAAGLTVSSGGRRVTLPADAHARQEMVETLAVLSATGKFPGGSGAYPVRDAVGTWHEFTVDQYRAAAVAVIAFAAGCRMVAAGCALHDDGNSPVGEDGLPAREVEL